jgi:hypothetical protein
MATGVFPEAGGQVGALTFVFLGASEGLQAFLMCDWVSVPFSSGGSKSLQHMVYLLVTGICQACGFF